MFLLACFGFLECFDLVLIDESLQKYLVHIFQVILVVHEESNFIFLDFSHKHPLDFRVILLFEGFFLVSFFELELKDSFDFFNKYLN